MLMIWLDVRAQAYNLILPELRQVDPVSKLRRKQRLPVWSSGGHAAGFNSSGVKERTMGPHCLELRFQ